MTTMKTPILTHATERDIDLLLVEELACSPEFLAWLLSRCSHSGSLRGKGAVLHSIRRLHSRREIDISVEADTTQGNVLLLIENKLDTMDQPRQAESYREEAETQAASPRFARVLTLLASPKDYAAANGSFADKFDMKVSYEDIADFFEIRSRRTSGEIAARQSYRATVLRQAIEKQRRGYVQVIHPAKRKFTERYVDELRKLAPTLIPGPSMLRESAAESVTMIFAKETLPDWPFLPQMRIVHQLREANANICFYTWGDHFTELAALMGADLSGTGYKIVPTINKRKNGRSGLMIVVDTPQVDHFSGFDQQIDAVHEGIRRTVQLRDWFTAHREEIRAWAACIEVA